MCTSKRYALHSDKIVPVVLFIALAVFSLNSVFALSYEADEDEPIIDTGIADQPQQIPDIVLKNFVLPNETYVNESVRGYFEVEVVNSTGITFASALTINNSDYTEEFQINESGIYNITPLVFHDAGSFSITMALDSPDGINETNENNNQETLEINAIPNNTEARQQGKPPI